LFSPSRDTSFQNKRVIMYRVPGEIRYGNTWFKQ